MANPVLAPNGEAYKNFVMGRVREIHFIAGYLLLFALWRYVFSAKAKAKRGEPPDY